MVNLSVTFLKKKRFAKKKQHPIKFSKEIADVIPKRIVLKFSKGIAGNTAKEITKLLDAIPKQNPKEYSNVMS